MKEAPPIRLLFRLLIAAVICVLALGFLVSPWGAAWNQFSYDLMFRLRGPQPAPDDIVIVAIDENSFDEVDLQWPWPRALHASLLDEVFDAGAKAVVFDLLFAEPSDEQNDAAFADAIRTYKNVALVNDVSVFEDPNLGYAQEKIVDPSPILERLDGEGVVGFNNMRLDADGFVRELNLALSGERALSWQAARLLVGGADLKADLNAPVRINFLGPGRTVPTASYYQALDAEQYLPKDFFRDKLVFVGLSTISEANAASGMADHFPVPFTRWGSGYMSGVEIHATAADSVLRNKFIRLVPMKHAMAISICFGMFAGILFFRQRPLVSTMLFALLGTAIYGSSFLMFRSSHVYISPVLLLLPAGLCYALSPFLHYWHARKQRAFIRQAFSTYLAPKLVNRLLEHPERLKLGGEEVDGTYVFLDIANFTSFSEKLNPDQLIGLVNRNLGRYAEIMLEWDGMIDKYIGDAIMAVWGVPIHQEGHAEKACSAMIAIREAFHILRAEEQETSGVALDIRVGIHSGKAVAGNVGGGQQFNYTVLGSAVNLASRLEGVNKLYGTDIVISEATAKIAGDGFVMRELDRVRVKGQNTPVTIFELVARKGEVSEQYIEFLELYQEGRAHYAAQRWPQAESAFAKAGRLVGGDYACSEFIMRTRYNKMNPLDETWDGVHDMETK